MYQIEKGIKITPRKTNKGKKINTRSKRGIYPFIKMQIGDSFLVPTQDSPAEKTYAVIKLRCCLPRSNKNIKVSIREIDGGIRCWRIK